ncbi:hypothetical protein [Paenibacillus abyssi]|uniref:Uncharacterized protein n=1 Tax=Paenibacillus abyssi TaxID=1340531 RepID=A0A917G6T4_9BACL|nr:hypothetical protein [Paenibacillus abyssi]GGG24713.1 hypothetical protein GCM10010916_46520 [Paenibacillus abyssi]
MANDNKRPGITTIISRETMFTDKKRRLSVLLTVLGLIIKAMFFRHPAALKG